MKAAPFAYAAPESLPEALALLQEYGADARILAGGQTLGPMLNMRMATPSVVLDINRLPGLSQINAQTDTVHMGALVRQRQAMDAAAISSSVPLLRAALPYVGHYQTRNRGTVCGSIAHADPTAELPLVLLTLGGTVSLASASGQRTLAADAFFLGALTTAREPDEMIVGLQCPLAKPGTGYYFEEVGVRHGHVAVVACAIAVRCNDKGLVEDLSVGLAGISDRPVGVDVWAFLGRTPDAAWRKAVAEHARSVCEFVDDLHASAAYRRHVAGWLIERGLCRAAGVTEEALAR